MRLHHENFVLFFLALIFNDVRSLNDTNVTITPTTEQPITSTLFFTTSNTEPIISTSAEPITSTLEPITSTTFEPILPTVNPPADLICVQYEIGSSLSYTDYSPWSGLYEITTINEKINNRRVWNLITEDKEYNLLFYDIENQWLLTKGDLVMSDGSTVDNTQIISSCDDGDDATLQPTFCFNWRIGTVSSVNIIMTQVEAEGECDVRSTIISTTIALGDSYDGSGDTKGAMEIGTAGYIGIGVGCGVLLLCFVCLVVYKRRESSATKQTDTGISLQPYVPSGMGYDTYKKNQTQQQQKKKKKKPKEKLNLKKPAPTSVASATAEPDEQESTANSHNALINVFDEDDNVEPAIDIVVGTMDEDNNPFLQDGVFNTGQTLVNEPTLGSDAMMSAFDE